MFSFFSAGAVLAAAFSKTRALTSSPSAKDAAAPSASRGRLCPTLFPIPSPSSAVELWSLSPTAHCDGGHRFFWDGAASESARASGPVHFRNKLFPLPGCGIKQNKQVLRLRSLPVCGHLVLGFVVLFSCPASKASFLRSSLSLSLSLSVSPGRLLCSPCGLVWHQKYAVLTATRRRVRTMVTRWRPAIFCASSLVGAVQDNVNCEAAEDATDAWVCDSLPSKSIKHETKTNTTFFQELIWRLLSVSFGDKIDVVQRVFNCHKDKTKLMHGCDCDCKILSIIEMKILSFCLFSVDKHNSQTQRNKTQVQASLRRSPEEGRERRENEGKNERNKERKEKERKQHGDTRVQKITLCFQHLVHGRISPFGNKVQRYFGNGLPDLLWSETLPAWVCTGLGPIAVNQQNSKTHKMYYLVITTIYFSSFCRFLKRFQRIFTPSIWVLREEPPPPHRGSSLVYTRDLRHIRHCTACSGKLVTL